MIVTFYCYETHASCPKIKTCDIAFSIGQILLRGFALFCNFVRNRIYVLECEVFEPVSIARKHRFLSLNSALNKGGGHAKVCDDRPDDGPFSAADAG